MKKNKLLIAVSAIVALVVVTIGIIKNRQQAMDDNMVRIGVILPLTGAVGFEGERVLASMQMAMEEVNAKSETNKFELVVEDGKWVAKDTITAYNRLMMKKVDALVVFGDTPCLTIKDASKNAEIPIFCISGVADLIEGNSWFIQCLFQSIGPTSKIADYAIRNEIYETSVLYLNEPLCQKTVAGFCEPYIRGKGKILSQDTFEWNDKDIKSVVAKALSNKPQAVFVFGYGPSYISVLNQLMTQKFNGIIMTDLNVIAVRKELLNSGDGIVYGDVDFGEESSNDATKEFIKNLKQMHGYEANAFAAFSYESIRILDGLIAKHGKSPNNILAGVSEIRDYSSIAGKLSYGRNRELETPILVKQLTKDSVKVLDK